MKKDSNAVLGEVAIAASIGLGELDGRVGGFGKGIGDAMLGVGEQSALMALQRVTPRANLD